MIASKKATPNKKKAQKTEPSLLSRQYFYDKYSPYFKEIAEDPDYIFSDPNHPNTAIACKTLCIDGANVHLVIRLAVEGEDAELENSIITALYENSKRYAQRIRNKIPLYKKE